MHRVSAFWHLKGITLFVKKNKEPKQVELSESEIETLKNKIKNNTLDDQERDLLINVLQRPSMFFMVK